MKKLKFWVQSWFETWMAESVVVALVLTVVTYLTGNRLVDWVGAAAVFYTFKHASVSDRLVEKQEIKPVPEVACYRKLRSFYLTKEVLWVVYFLATKSYPPLVGCGVFLLYPFWRKFWRRYHPLPRASQDTSDSISPPGAAIQVTEITLTDEAKKGLQTDISKL